MQINIKPLVYRKLGDLLETLLEKNYFSTEEKALAYVKEIRAVIEHIPTSQHYPTKEKSFGQFYASYKPNRHTTWYILFDVEGDRYIVRNLINNHTPDYPKFIASLNEK